MKVKVKVKVKGEINVNVKVKVKGEINVKVKMKVKVKGEVKVRVKVNPVNIPPVPIRDTLPSHFDFLFFITLKILGKQCSSLSTSLCSFLHSTFYKLQSVQM